MKTNFSKDYIDYCIANQEFVTKLWKELKEPYVWQVEHTPLLDLTQLLYLLEAKGFKNYNFYYNDDETRIIFQCLHFKEEASTKEQVVLKTLQKIYSIL